MPVPPPPPPPPPAPPPPPPPLHPAQPPPSSITPQGWSDPSRTQRPAPGGRSALLADIQKGTKLKKVATVNDRSAPVIDKPKGSRPDSAANSGGLGGSGALGGPVSSGPPLAGLFAEGFPVLRPTGHRDTTVPRSSGSGLRQPVWSPPASDSCLLEAPDVAPPPKTAGQREPHALRRVSGGPRAHLQQTLAAPSRPTNQSTACATVPAPCSSSTNHQAHLAAAILQFRLHPPPPLQPPLPKVPPVPSPAFRAGVPPQAPSYPTTAPSRRPPAVPRPTGAGRFAPPPAPPARSPATELSSRSTPQNPPPPPPPLPPSVTRNGHLHSLDDFESKFQFHPIDDFPPPDEFKPFPRIYPSKEARESTRPAPLRTHIR